MLQWHSTSKPSPYVSKISFLVIISNKNFFSLNCYSHIVFTNLLLLNCIQFPNLCRRNWSDPCFSRAAYIKGSFIIFSHDSFQYTREFFLLRSASHAAPSIPIVCWGWSLITCIGCVEFSLHSFTAESSRALSLLSRSRDEKTST